MADQGALSYLFNGSQPNAVDTSAASSNGMPAWYQQYLAGIAGKATQIAGGQANMGVPAQSVAGFNPDQTQAFQNVRNNQGAWQPNINAATTAAGSIAPGAATGIANANAAVAGPAQTWDNAAATKYMSPYTTQVIDNIQRLGMRNLNENLLPAVQDQFIGSGGFGSTRNADILGRTVRDANTDINGQVTNALNSGYTNAQTMFTNDANREQQQQQLQGNTAIAGVNAGTAAGSAASGALGTLGQMTQNLNLSDSQQLGAIGSQQQSLDQAGLNAGYANEVNKNNFDWNTINNLSSTVRGQQLPAVQSQTINAPSTTQTPYGSSVLGQVGALTAAAK
jgi:hypothetical protein